MHRSNSQWISVVYGVCVHEFNKEGIKKCIQDLKGACGRPMQCIVISYNLINKVSQAWMRIVGDFIGLMEGHLSRSFINLNSFLNMVLSVLSPSLEREVPMNLFFLPSTRRGIWGHPYKLLQDKSYRPFRWGPWNTGKASSFPRYGFFC